jgi:hypothetical protein
MVNLSFIIQGLTKAPPYAIKIRKESFNYYLCALLNLIKDFTQRQFFKRSLRMIKRRTLIK